MILIKILNGKITRKQTKQLFAKMLLTVLLFLSFSAALSGKQLPIHEEFTPGFIDVFPNASIGPTIENLTKTDPTELGSNAFISADINHTDNGVDEVLIDIGGTNYTMNWESGNEYNYTWQPSAVGNIPFTIYANASTIGDLSTVSDSLDVQDTTAPNLSPVNEFSGDPVEYNGAIEIRIDATDSLLDEVWIVFDSENYTMSPESGDTYSYTNGSLPLGTYTYTVYANDTTGNLATSSSGDITVEDSTGPLLTTLNEFSGDPVEYNNGIEIRIDATDLLLEEVWIVFDGENYTMSPVSGDTYSYTNNSLALGTYTYRIYANDTEGNLASSAINDITVEDSTDPLLTTLNEFSGDPVEYNNGIEIRIDATDLLLDEVWIVFDGENYTMSPVSGDTFAYTNSSLSLATYTYTVYANDTTGNLATSTSGDITVEDSTDPVLSIPNEFSGDPVEYDNGIEIRVDATDLLLDEVWIVFDGEIYSMSFVSGDTYSYTNNSLALGTYSYTIYADDTTGNTANTLAYDITVEDTTDPVLSIPNEFSGDPVEYNGGIEIRVDATDLLLDEVWIVFDGETYAMSPVSGDTYSYTNNSLALGTYSYTIYADDTTGNTDNTLAYDITVEDTTDPVLSIPNEFSGDPVEFNGGIEIRVDATDLLLDEVWIVFDGETYAMSPVSGDTYSYTNNSLAIGTYSYTIYADDTTGNTANTLAYDITVEDTTDPVLSIPNEFSGDPVEFNGGIEIRVDATDLLLDEVWIVFDGETYAMSPVSGDTYSYTNSSLALGTYSYTIYADDTTGNIGNTLGYDITVEDTTDPVLSIPNEFSGDPVEYDNGIEIRVDATDLLLDEVWIIFDGETYTMSLVSGDTYTYTNGTLAVGTYSYTIYADDTTGNTDNTLAYDITVEDTTDPVLSIPNEFSGDPVEYNGGIEIRVDATDLLLDEVWIVFDGETYTMSFVSGDTYSYTNNSLALGTYSYTIYADDTTGNTDNTLAYDITVEDTIDPVLSIPNEFSGDPVEYNGGIEIRIDATDLLLDEVWIVFDGEIYSMSLVSGDTYTYTNGTLAVGIYSYTIYADDTTGNTDNTLAYDITVEDTTDTTLGIPVEVSGDPTQSGEIVNITVDVTDLLLDSVWIVFESENYSMILVSGNTYSYANASVAVGTYSYTIYANDTEGNLATSLLYDIEVSDIAPPVILDITEVSGEPTEFDVDIYIRVNVSHSLGVDEVWIDFSGSNYSMTYISGDMYYFTGTYGINVYSYTIYANSSIGIEGSLGPYTITVSDNTGPTTDNVVEVSGDPVEFGGSIYIRVNVSDLSIIDSVWIVFDGTSYDMTPLSGSMYYYSNSSIEVGVYSYSIYANDTYSNEENTITYNIAVSDTTEPIIDNVVEVNGDPIAYNGTLAIRVNVTDFSALNSIWIEIEGENHTMNSLGSDMFNYTGIHGVGIHSYTIYANDTYGNVETVTGDITVSEYTQSMIIFDVLDYPTANLTADTNFTVILSFDDNSTLDWAKIYFILESGIQAAAPGDDWTPITLVNGQATISSEYFDAGETLSYYFEIKDTYGVTFYVSSTGIRTSNSSSQTDAFSFQITAAPPPPFDLQKWLPYILGAVGLVVVGLFISVGVKKARIKRDQRDFPELMEAGAAADELLVQQKNIQKEAIKAEKEKDYYTAITLYEKLIIIANELFKFGRPSEAGSIKHYKAKITKCQERLQKTVEPNKKQAIQQKAAEFMKMAEDSQRDGDFENALIIYHQVILLREQLRDKSQISATKAKIKNLIPDIPNIKEMSARILKQAEEKYQAEEYQTAYANYQYLKTIFDALGDKNLINTVDKLISDVSKHLK